MGNHISSVGADPTGMDWPVRILIRWHNVTALNLHTLPCLDVKELFIYWYNFVAEDFEPLPTLTGVKNWTQWHALTAAKWTFFLLCSENLPAVTLGMLGNTTHLNILTSVKLED